MWKYILLTLVVATALHAEDNVENLDDRNMNEVFNDNIRRKCLKVHNDTKIFDNAMDTLDACIRTHRHQDFSETIEGLDSTRILSCTDQCVEHYMQEVAGCLSPEEQHLPDFVISVKEEQCKDDGKVFKDKMKGYFQVKCDSTIIMTWYGISMICEKKLKFVHHKSEPDFVFTLSDICSDIKTYHDCALEIIPKSCGNDDYIKYASVFFEPYLYWCKQNGNELQ